MSPVSNLSQAPKKAEQGNASPAKVLCREIRTTDANEVINLLTRGFAGARDRQFWIAALQCMSEHETPPGLPKHGYILESRGRPVGIILLIFTAVADGPTPRIQCSVSSWYVDPEFRAFATLLISCALKHKHVTYFNVTPAPHTWETLRTQGFRQFSSGRVMAIPLLGAWSGRARVEAIRPQASLDDREDLPDFELTLLRAHADRGCISLVCHAGGQSYPFVLAPRRKAGVLGFAFLIYCRDIKSFASFAGAIGRFLALRGIALVMIDADGPIKGIVGPYSETNPKYFKGPNQPRLGNLAYSDRALFGV